MSLVASLRLSHYSACWFATGHRAVVTSTSWSLRCDCLCELATRVEIELSVDLAQVVVDGAGADVQLAGDLFVGEPTRDYAAPLGPDEATDFAGYVPFPDAACRSGSPVISSAFVASASANWRPPERVSNQVGVPGVPCGLIDHVCKEPTEIDRLLVERQQRRQRVHRRARCRGGSAQLARCDVQAEEFLGAVVVG